MQPESLVRMADQITAHKVAAEKGGGRCVFYEVKKGEDPPVVKNAEEIEGQRWVCVLFPERVGWACKTRAAGLKEVRDGIYLTKKINERAAKAEPAKKSGKAKKQKPEGVVHARARRTETPAPAKAPKRAQTPVVEGNASEARGGNEEELKGRAPIPEGTGFDEAMDIRFPVSRVMDELEDLVTASSPVYVGGDHLGDKPDYMTRTNALKMVISYREGLARAREKPPPKEKRIGFQQLEEMIMSSPQACEVMAKLVQQARSHQAMQKAGVGAAKVKRGAAA